MADWYHAINPNPTMVLYNVDIPGQSLTTIQQILIDLQFNFILTMLLLGVLALLTTVTASPLAMRTAPPFQGNGQLAVILNGAQTGCLTSAWQVTVDSTRCAIFKAALVSEKASQFGTFSWTTINSTEGACGYQYHPNNSGVENTQYILACGNTEKSFITQLDVSYN